VKDEEIDEILTAARVPGGFDPERLKRVAQAIRATLQPVRLLPPRWVLTVALVLICSLVAVAGAARAGFFGIERMDVWQRILIFSTIGFFALLAGNEFVNAMIPGSRRRVSTGVLLGAGILALLGVFALSFRDYQTTHFVSAGIVCLVTGLLHAIPAALLSAFVLRRGFAVDAVAAGWIAGALAGLAGLGVLELHCQNFQATHVLVWHTAVVPASAAGGALCAWVLRRLRRTSESSQRGI
jgi:hypothetical protein